MTDLASPHFSGLPITLKHTLPSVIAHLAALYADKPFTVGEDGRVSSFAEFWREVRRLARALIRQGVTHGDRVAIWAPNSPEWIVAAAATEVIGAILVPINTRFRGAEAAFALGKTRARVLFTVGSFLGKDYAAMLRDAAGGAGGDGPVRDLPALKRIVMLDAPLDDWPQGLAAEAELEARLGAVTPETIADILFTSGTTGQPKGAMHAHGQAIWMPAIWNEANDLRPADRMVIVNPFFHSFGYRSGWVSGLIAGITLYPMATFNPGAVLALIAREKITVLMGPPTIFLSLMDHPDFASFDLSSLRVGHTGASNVPVDLIYAARDVFGFDLFLTSFGQTEATALITVNGPEADVETVARTVGKPLRGVELRIAAPDDEKGNEPSGEILVRGPNVMQGYFEEAEQTAAAIDPDGWLHTGDVGCIDTEGRLRVLDRLKDMVIVGGFNAYPAEIENALRAHPAIADVCILAWPDQKMGEVCAACVILRPGATLSLTELSEWSRERLANYKVPRHLFLVDDFPRTPLGKVQKFLLREQVSTA